MNFINSYIAEKHVVEEALNVVEVGGRRESQRAAPNSEGHKPWIYRHYLGREARRTDTYHIYSVLHLRRSLKKYHHGNSPYGLPC